MSGSEDGDKHASHVIGRLWVVECVPREGGWVRMIEVNESGGKHAYAAVKSVVLNHRWDMPDRSCGESILDVQQFFIVSDALHSGCEVHGDGQRIVGDCMWTGVRTVVSHEKCPVLFRDVIRKE